MSTGRVSYRFGPLKVDPDTHVFRLWAPDAGSVDLLLRLADETAPRLITMDRDPNGWYISPREISPPGSRYAFLIDGKQTVPDPASRMQDDDVHGFSVVVDAGDDQRSSPDTAGLHWANHPWEHNVVYELHVGAAGGTGGGNGDRYRDTGGTQPGRVGTFADLAGHLPRLVALGVTTVELMPVADFPGARNWGYDGVLPFAPDRTYGTPADLKAAVDAAHRAGIAVWLDVVYNHFGPDGNYLHLYAGRFFSEALSTPWGAGIDFSVPEVRRFFIENALYWIHDIGIDGLRLDAVHAIHDDGEVHILTELAETVRASLPPNRNVHLVVENDANETRFLNPGTAYHGQWNDDFHHVVHVLLTGETHGYYRDYAEHADRCLLRALTEGFVYQGQPSGAHGGRPRGEPSTHLSPTRFISFLQNHDQIGNRAWGDRLTTLASPTARATAYALFLLTPQIPMLFMGEEWDLTTPFLFFCDFDGHLAEAVTHGRRREFDLEDLPDPGAQDTFVRSMFPPSRIAPPSASTSDAERAFRRVQTLLDLRREHLTPLLKVIEGGRGTGGGAEAISVRYPAGRRWWCIDVNLAGTPRPVPPDPRGSGTEVGGTPDAPPVFSIPHRSSGANHTARVMPAWSITVWKEFP